MSTLLNSRRREAVGLSDEYTSPRFGHDQQQQNDAQQASQSPLSGGSSGGQYGQMGPSLLERMPFSMSSLDFQQHPPQHTPLIQYDHDDEVLLSGGSQSARGNGMHFSNTSSRQLSPKNPNNLMQTGSGRFGNDSQAQLLQGQTQNKYTSQSNSYMSYGGVSGNDGANGTAALFGGPSFLERVTSPGLGDSLEHTFPPPGQHDGLLGHLGSARGHSSMSVGGVNNQQQQQQQQQGGSGRSSVGSSFSARSFSHGHGSMSPLDSPPIQSRSSMTRDYPSQQQQQQQGNSGLSTMSASELGWIKEEIERSQQREANQQQQQQQQHMQHGNPLIQNLHNLSNSMSNNGNGNGNGNGNVGHSGPHHHRGGSNSAPVSNRASTNINDMSSPLPLVYDRDPPHSAGATMGSGSSNGGVGNVIQLLPGGGLNGVNVGLNGVGVGVGVGSGGGVMDEMKLKKYKTVMCQRMVRTGGCRYGALCDFAHDRLELRRNLDVHWYYAVKCEKRMCADPECRYSHNDHEVMYHPRIYKTRICANYVKPAGCSRKMYCSFAHGKYELRHHNNNNLMMGGPGNIFGLGPPQQQQQQQQQQGQQQQGQGQGQGGLITNNNNIAIIPPPSVLPPGSSPQNQNQQGQQQQGQGATLTIAGGSQVLPRELVASLQASGINISAPHEHQQHQQQGHQSHAHALPHSRSSTGMIGLSMPSFSRLQGKFQGQQGQLLGHNGGSGAASHSTSPRPSPSPQHSDLSAQMLSKDSFALGLGSALHHDHSHNHQQPQQQHRGEGANSPFVGDHLSPHFAQLGLGGGGGGGEHGSSAAHVFNHSAITSALGSSTGSIGSGVGGGGGALLSSPSSGAGGAARSELFREQTDHLKIRILDLVDEVASMHYARACDDAQAQLAGGAVLKMVSANLQSATASLAATKGALAIYGGEETALAALSGPALDALAAHLATVVAAVAQAKAKLPAVESTTAAAAVAAAEGTSSPTGSATPNGALSPSVSSVPSPAAASGRCQSCQVEAVACVVLPCAHRALCAACPQPDSCPACEGPVSKVVPLVTELPLLAPLLAPAVAASSSGSVQPSAGQQQPAQSPAGSPANSADAAVAPASSPSGNGANGSEAGKSASASPSSQ